MKARIVGSTTFVYLAILAATLFVFWWSYERTEADLLDSIKLSVSIGSFFVSLFLLRRLHFEQKASGIGEAEYLLKQAGGAQDLLSQAFSTLVVGWVYVAVTLGLPLIVGFATKSFALGATGFVLSAVLCGPAAYSAFRFYSKARRIAQEALQELSRHDAQPRSQQDAAR